MASSLIVPRFVRIQRPDRSPPSEEATPGARSFVSASGDVVGGAQLALESFEARCVILVGEPGLGKSTVLKQRAEILGNKATHANFNNPDEVERVMHTLDIWASGVESVHLLLDTLDEAAANVGVRLAARIKQGKPDRIRLELACRSGEFLHFLKGELPKFFGKDDVQFLELLPLRDEDVDALVTSRGVAAGAFAADVTRLSLQPLTEVPILLNLLLESYLREGSLPTGVGQLYGRACQALCEETSLSRLDTRGCPDVSTRIKTAKWVAVCSVLGHSSVISRASVPIEGRLSLATLIVDGGPSQVELEDVFRSALFTAAGPDLVEFRHRSLAEFLAASWLQELEDRPLVRRAITHQDASNEIPAQLYGLTTWLCSLDLDLAVTIAELRPECVLEASSVVASDRLAKALFRSFFERVRSREVSSPWLRPHQLERMRFVGYEVEVRRILAAAPSEDLSKRVAIDLLSESPGPETAGVLIGLTTEENLEPDVRAKALEAAWRAFPDDRKHPLIPTLLRLAKADDASDGRDCVRAAAIAALWPRAMSFEDLVIALRPPTNDSYFGSYAALFWELPERFDASQIAFALRWMRSERGQSRELLVEKFCQQVCLRALVFLECGEVRQELGRTMYARMDSLRRIFPGYSRTDESPLRTDVELRRAVLSSLVTHADSWGSPWQLFGTQEGLQLVSSADLAFLVASYASSPDGFQERWASLIREVLRRDVVPYEAVELVLRQENVSNLLPWPPVFPLDDPEVIEARRLGLRSVDPPKAVDDPSNSRAKIVARRVEQASGPEAWETLVAHMYRASRFEDRFDLKRLAHWSELSDSTKLLFVDKAAGYLSSSRPSTKGNDWVNQTVVTTLQFVQDQAPTLWEHKRVAWLEAWSHEIVKFREVQLLHSEESCAGFRGLVDSLFFYAPATAESQLARLLEERAPEDPLTFLSLTPPCRGLVPILCSQLRRAGSSVEAARALFELLARSDVGASIQLAISYVRDESLPLEHRSTICADLCVHCGERGWREALDACAEDYQLAASATPRVARSASPKMLPPDILARIVHVFGPTLRASRSPREKRIFDERETLVTVALDELTQNANSIAIDNLRALASASPDDDMLRRRVHEAMRRHSEHTWRALSPAELRALVRSRRPIRSSTELREAVVIALEAYEIHLQSASPPAIADLWNSEPGRPKVRQFHPKDEVEVSDHLARFLKTHLKTAIINREVEVKPKEPSSPGERSDLLVQVTDGTSRFAVVVEVKCSWNDGLLTDLEQQLHDRYMRREGLDNGIYVVGWFDCTDWIDEPRRKNSRKLDRLTTKQTLQHRAAELSVNGRRIDAVVVDCQYGGRPTLGGAQ